jgi:acetyl esterase/lipase
MSSEDILTLAPAAADARLPYGTDANQFGELRLPKSKGPFPALLNIHGGFWRSKYDLAHASHLCAALAGKGVATWNIEYRRVGNPGGGWPGTFQDVRNAFRYLGQLAGRYNIDVNKTVVMGHSAGGELALCLGTREPSIRGVVSLAGVVDLKRAYEDHLSNDAVVQFLGGTPGAVPEHYHEADPMQIAIKVPQWLIHGLKDTDVPPTYSHSYVESKKAKGEDAHLLEIATADHFDLIDPRSSAWQRVESTVLHLAGL